MLQSLVSKRVTSLIMLHFDFIFAYLCVPHSEKKNVCHLCSLINLPSRNRCTVRLQIDRNAVQQVAGSGCVCYNYHQVKTVKHIKFNHTYQMKIFVLQSQ